MSSEVNTAFYQRLAGIETLQGDFLACQQALAARLGQDADTGLPCVEALNKSESVVYPCITFRPSAGIPDRRFGVDAAVDNGVYDLEVWGKTRLANEVTDIAASADRLLLSRLGAPPLPAPGRIYSIQTFVTLVVMYDAPRHAWFGLTRYKIVERLR